MTPRVSPFATTARRAGALVAAALALAALLTVPARTAGPRFFDDDPLQREPASQDASGVAPWDIDLIYDLSYNLFVVASRKPSGLKAGNVNTVDEVPDSTWFSNRIGRSDLPVEDVVRGPNVDDPPDPSAWTIVREKSSGFAPGFTARDAKGQTWFLSFDPPSNPEGATAALVIATKIFWALGYNQVEYFLTTFDPARVTLDPGATMRRPSGKRTPFTRGDLAAVLGRAARNADGSYRVAAGRLLPGKVLGGFRYQGTRPDDPNDIVPHEHRRELRALRVFGAWTNLTDMKAGNTLDTLVTERGHAVVQHYLQDVGSTFGIAANGPHDWDEGWEYLLDREGSRHRLLTLGFWLSPWQTAHYEEYPAVGRFEGDAFDPEAWKPHVPTAAYVEMRDDDAFWAAQRVMEFNDGLIRAIVKTGAISRPEAEQYLGDVLIKRRDKIGRVYLTKINPISSPALDADGTLTFVNEATSHGFAPVPRQCTADWFAFDNATGESRPIGQTSGAGERLAAPSGLPSGAGAYLRVDLAADEPGHPSWKRPVRAFFKRDGAGWRLVGFERTPES